MSDTKEQRFNVTADDIRKYDWQRLIFSATWKNCDHFHSLLARESGRLKDEGDDLGYRVYGLLSVIASFHPNYGKKGNPYDSWYRIDGNRALNTEDLTAEDLAALGGIVFEIDDPEYRARVADVLWVTNKDYKTAQLAIASFLESASLLKTGDDMWPPYVERLERAAKISAHRGFEEIETKVVSTVEDAIKEFENDLPSGILCLRLMGILLFLGQGDKAKYAALAERLARDFAGVANWNFSESYWEVAEKWYRLNKNDTDADRCRLEAAECNISRAEAGLPSQKSDLMYRSHWLGRGLEALRRAKADTKRIQEVHKRLLEMEKKGLSELTTTEIDRETIPGLVEAENEMQKRAAEFIQGLPINHAIIRMANITRPVVLAELSEQYEISSKDTIYDKIVGTVAIDHVGKVTDTIAPVGSGTKEEEATNLRKRLTQHARTIHWPIKVKWFIEPARQSLIDEHAVGLQDLHFLILNNPFVPPGHEGIYLRGLQAGFNGDWLLAMHLLVPQIENSIRYVLNQKGIVTTTMRNGVQAEKNINDLLPSEEIKQIFDEDIIFDLRGMLIEDFGFNLRNNLSHALMTEAAFYDVPSVYLWWLTLHICWNGFVMVNASTVSSEQDPE